MTVALALIFTLIAPGSGHVLTGNCAQGIVIGVLFALGKNALLPLSLRIFHVQTLKRTLQAFYVCNWCYIALIFYAVASAFWCALKAREQCLGPAVLVALMIILVQKNTRSKIIFTALCGRAGMWEILQKMRKSPTEKK
ncbi:MAG: hypothetical protein J6V32_06585 [Elusimicrobiaceae bacterium]|nr:hypothetical protein [Elusimicrobiaceae bacterium]